MNRQFSAGGIVFKDNLVLLAKNSSIKNKKQEFWGFPKGHLEGKETSKEAALREVEEESGIKAGIIEKVGESKYVFTQLGEKIFKVVNIFLMEYESGELKRQESEITEVKWVDPKEALEILTFKNDKQLLKKAIEIHG